MKRRGQLLLDILQRNKLKSNDTDACTNTNKDVDDLNKARPSKHNTDDGTKCNENRGLASLETKKSPQQIKPVFKTNPSKDADVSLDQANPTMQDNTAKFTEIEMNNIVDSFPTIDIIDSSMNHSNNSIVVNSVNSSSVSDKLSVSFTALADEEQSNSTPEICTTTTNDRSKDCTRDALILSLITNHCTSNKTIDEPLLSPHPIVHNNSTCNESYDYCPGNVCSSAIECSSSNDPILPIADPNNCSDSVEDCFVNFTPDNYCNTGSIIDRDCSKDNPSVSVSNHLYNGSILNPPIQKHEDGFTDDIINNMIFYSVDDGGSGLIDSTNIVLQEDPNVIIEEISQISEEATDESNGIVMLEVNDNNIDNMIQNEDIVDNVLDQPLDENMNKKKRKHSRIAKPSSWEKNVRKQQRMSGQSYTSAKGKVMQAKKFNPTEECKCKFKCSSNVSVEQQNNLFKEYWNFSDYCRQKMYVSALVEEKPIERKRKRMPDKTNKEKSKSRSYFLPGDNNDRVRVCLQFFCNVFQISFQVIYLALKRSSVSGVYTGQDGRANRPAPNRTSDEAVSDVKRHIDSFPRMESHYCRKDSKKLYLSPDLNLSELYRLYVNDFCLKNSIQPVKEGVYRSIFKKYDPPLATFVPKKDQCSKCNQYRDATDKTSLEENYRIHSRRKKAALDMKKEDMNCKEKNKLTATFDLQAVLLLPFAGDAQIYYKRKLSVYNFTVFDSTGNGFCYLWDECNGMKGSSEIGTGLLNYMQDLPSHVNHLVTYSDTCGGQNRNQFIASAMLYVVNTSATIETVDMKYMEPGHTYLEADSMHATIERARKHKKVYTTEEWALLIGMARRRPRPYSVKLLKFSDMLDLTSLGKKIMLNRSKDTEGKTVKWLGIKWLRFKKGNPFTIQFKYELDDEIPFKEIAVFDSTRLSWDAIIIAPKYKELIPISSLKKNDLLYLLKIGVIPASYSYFIQNLPSSIKSTDVAPYEMADETEENDEEYHQPKPLKTLAPKKAPKHQPNKSFEPGTSADQLTPKRIVEVETSRKSDRIRIKKDKLG